MPVSQFASNRKNAKETSEMLVVAFGKQWEEHKFSSGFPSLKPV
jgi:hypothetical protein